jgi:electron transfer flavoprotein alpha subunit
METILFLAHTAEGGALPSAALETLEQARTLAAQLQGAELVVALFGSAVQQAADQIATCGAKRFLAVTGADFEQPRFATDVAAAEALCHAVGPTFVLAAATSRINRTLAAVAYRLCGRADTHISGLQVTGGALTVNRWYYRQRMEATLQRTQRPWFIGLDPGSSAPWRAEPGKATVEFLEVPITEGQRRTTVLGLRQVAADAQTIRPEAKMLLVAGAGWTKKQGDGQPHTKEAEKLIMDFLKLARSSLGSSKSLVDLSGEAVLPFLTHLNQIGQTGSSPRHPKGLATCCHGEEPHTVGWRFINERRAINLDPNCGWARGKADVLYVADAFAVMAKVNQMLGS